MKKNSPENRVDALREIEGALKRIHARNCNELLNASKNPYHGDIHMEGLGNAVSEGIKALATVARLIEEVHGKAGNGVVFIESGNKEWRVPTPPEEALQLTTWDPKTRKIDDFILGKPKDEGESNDA